MKKRLFLIILIPFFTINIYSQIYTSAIGARLGNFSGLTVKHFLNEVNPIEGILSDGWLGHNRLILTGLYEYQKPINELGNLYWYVGFGAHIEFASGFGVDLIGGFEYNFKDAPLSIGLDWKPAFNFIGNTNYWGGDLALSVRYIFN
jgi:hypothetical protein